MEVITIDSKAYRELEAKLDVIMDYVRSLELKLKGEGSGENPDETWVDSYEVCTFLKISSRTLQRLRSKKVIAYSVLGGKTYYTLSEIKRVLSERKIRTSQECLEDLIHNHRLYAKQRKQNK